MIQQVAHAEPGADPAGVGTALAVAYELHPPARRAPEVAPAAAAGAAERAAGRRRSARRSTSGG
ncbi:hypothetical protein [Streptomyces sp. NPDC002788]